MGPELTRRPRLSDGKVTHEYGTVLNGFAAEIAPETFQLLTQSATDDGPISYIGLCTSSGFADSYVNSGLFRTRWRAHYPIEKMSYLQARKDDIERALCKVMFIVKCTQINYQQEKNGFASTVSRRFRNRNVRE